jgi:hypothetical protein
VNNLLAARDTFLAEIFVSPWLWGQHQAHIKPTSGIHRLDRSFPHVALLGDVEYAKTLEGRCDPQFRFRLRREFPILDPPITY